MSGVVPYKSGDKQNSLHAHEGQTELLRMHSSVDEFHSAAAPLTKVCRLLARLQAHIY